MQNRVYLLDYSSFHDVIRFQIVICHPCSLLSLLHPTYHKTFSIAIPTAKLFQNLSFRLFLFFLLLRWLLRRFLKGKGILGKGLLLFPEIPFHMVADSICRLPDII